MTQQQDGEVTMTFGFICARSNLKDRWLRRGTCASRWATGKYQRQ